MIREGSNRSLMPVFNLTQNPFDIVGHRLVPEIEISNCDNIRTHRVRETGLAPGLSCERAIPIMGRNSIPFICRPKRSLGISRRRSLRPIPAQVRSSIAEPRDRLDNFGFAASFTNPDQ